MKRKPDNGIFFFKKRWMRTQAANLEYPNKVSFSKR